MSLTGVARSLLFRNLSSLIPRCHFELHFPHLVICSQTQYIEPNAQILSCDAESDLELLNVLDQEITVDNLCEILKQNAFEGSQV
jgi:hypothetical protein